MTIKQLVPEHSLKVILHSNLQILSTTVSHLHKNIDDESEI